MAIYLKTETKFETPRELLAVLFNITCFYGYKSVATYYDKDCTEEQCEEEKYRSIDEVVEIFQTYFPNITKQEVAFYLFSTELGGYPLQHGMCSDIYQPTMMFGRMNYGNIGDEKLNSLYDGSISWNDFAKLVNITNQTEKFEFIGKFKNTSFEDYLTKE